ncbi:TetR family transcriptional regulator [Dictyobacter sp. S3.2.2.5]|uniref:TetR family transcriptional regulator n=1 Tax=Dictyobacter halimunensis TaxID=3026934 RepID=A0ABQ6G7T0_9CHLR|nr:TetR family transcriptional regulator [Dictyobacter sp. S3.2.2.5]
MQLTRDDWIQAGLRVLATAGIDSVKIEALAKELHISKGSFYHYWPNRAQFLDALLLAWEVGTTHNTIDALEKIDSPRERFLRLFEVSFSADKSLEAAIHRWASIDVAVARRVAAVEEVRMAYITRLLCDMGKPFTQASELARLCYFIYLGWIDWSERNENVSTTFAEIQRLLLALNITG